MNLRGILFILLFYPTAGYSQGYFTRLDEESIQEMLNRFIEHEQEHDTLEESTYDILHDAVEIQFGESKEKRIVAVVDRNDGSDYAQVIIFSTLKNNQYEYDYFGEIAIGFPNSDRILSIFGFDYDEDGQRELFIAASGEVRGKATEEGLSGCCVTIYITYAFKEDESNVDERFNDIYQQASTAHTAKEIKAEVVRRRMDKKITDIYSEGKIKEHLKRLDSVDKVYGINAPRELMDKIYQLSFGNGNQKKSVVSFIRKKDSASVFYTGVFFVNAEGNYSYVESEGKYDEAHDISFGINSNIKVESIFTYDADHDEKGNKELIVLLSTSGEINTYETLIMWHSDYGIYIPESWEYGVHTETNAAEIKKAIDYYHKHKYDEVDEDSGN